MSFTSPLHKALHDASKQRTASMQLNAQVIIWESYLWANIPKNDTSKGTETEPGEFFEIVIKAYNYYTQLI